MNTFGEEIFNDLTVLQSYFYGIYDLAIGGKCKCNGHASECIPVPGQSTDGQTNNTARLMCNCQHNTEGTDCERCKPFYNNQPWKMATDLEANECEGKFNLNDAYTHRFTFDGQFFLFSFLPRKSSVLRASLHLLGGAIQLLYVYLSLSFFSLFFLSSLTRPLFLKRRVVGRIAFCYLLPAFHMHWQCVSENRQDIKEEEERGVF